MLREHAQGWMTRAQPFSRFSTGALGLALVLASYCLVHGLISGERASPLVSPAWGLSLALPWCAAWEALKRLPPAPAGLAPACAVLLAALFADVVLETLVANLAFPATHRSAAELAYARLPLALLAGTAWLLLRGRARPPAGVILNVPTRTGTLALSARDIDYVRAAGNYVELATAGRCHLLRRTLRELDALLAADGFVRVHRSLLVNAARVVDVQSDARRLPSLRLACGTRLPVGRRYRKALARLDPGSRAGHRA